MTSSCHLLVVLIIISLSQHGPHDEYVSPPSLRIRRMSD
jgi:hypothetical protein